MLQSKLFGKTSKTAPKDADSVNAALLAQAGFVHKVGAGIYEYLPLGLRVLNKIEDIVREEMNAIDGQEILMPIIHPIELWKATGRDKTMDDVLFRSEGHGGSDYVLGASHEETVTPLLARFVQSYKDLPISVYQIQNKFRNEPRVKSGLLRGREFGMKDMYSFHATKECLDEYYDRTKVAYTNVYNRCGLTSIMAEAGGGAFTDEYTHEFQVECDYGEDTLIITDEKAQNIEVADLMHDHKNPDEAEAELKEIEVTRGLSVEDNAQAHNCEDWRILKTVVFKLESGGFVGVCIRGDLQVSKEKAAAYFGEKVFAASPEELESLGLVQGFISPVNNDIIDFIGDLSVDTVNNYVTGANKQDLDVVGVNVGRDFTCKEYVHLADISGYEGIKEVKATEVGNIFKLGTKFSEACDLTFNDAEGNVKHVIMGCYGIGTTRLMGTIAELYHDDKGLMWPKSVAPFHVHLIHLGNSEDVIEAAEDLYEDLKDAGFEVLYDDRDAGPGAKLADSDLVGIPVRIVIGNKTIGEQSCEWKLRNESDASIVKLTDVASKLSEFYAL